MKYMGSKSRFAKELLPIMLMDRGNRAWIEPFVGGGNMIDKVQGVRIGADSNRYAIEALITIRDNVLHLPKNNIEFTEEDYEMLREDDTYKYKGYAGFAFSYGAKWLGGWRRDKLKKRDYVSEAYRNALKQSPKLQGVSLLHKTYRQLEIPKNSLIYCDPPYEGTTQYRDQFNHSDFWEWCREMVIKGHKVFISEYNAPDDFVCIWQKETVSSLTKDTGSKKAIEKLFKHKSQHT